MNWLPIGTYDEMETKPKFAVFYIKAQPPGKGRTFYLNELVATERRYGTRVITHWMPLPDPPK